MAQEMQEDVQEQEEISSDTGARVKYFLATAVPAGIGLEVLGASTIGLAIAGIAGITAAFFCPEIRDAVGSLPHLPHVDMSRWVTRRVYYDEGEQEATLEPLSDETACTLSEGDELPADESVTPLEPLQTVTCPVEQEGYAPIFPIYPEEATLRLGTAVISKKDLATLIQAYANDPVRYAHLAIVKKIKAQSGRFDPHWDMLPGKGFIIAANQGFGKSILNGLVLEQAGRAGIPTFVMDYKGEYDTAKRLRFMNVILAGLEGPDYALTTDETNIDELIEKAMSRGREGKRHQVIIDLPSYGVEWLPKAAIVGAMGKGLMRYAQRQRKAGKLLLPSLVVVDEAQMFFPQNVNLLPAEALANKDVLAELSNAYFALVSNGRSNGFTMCFATQSLTYIAKWAIKSLQIRIFGRHSEKNDLDAVCEIIDSAIASRQEIEAFPPGVAVVFGFTQKPVVVQFDMKQSKDKSGTPNLQRLLLTDEQINLQDVQEEDLEEMSDVEIVGLIERLPDVREEEKEAPVAQPVARIRELPADVLRVYRVYQPGMSQRDIARALTAQGHETNQTRVKYQMDQLYLAGYIDRLTKQKLVKLAD